MPRTSAPNECAIFRKERLRWYAAASENRTLRAG